MSILKINTPLILIKHLGCLVWLLWSGQSPAQSLFNGSFEEHDLDTINCHQTYSEVDTGVAYTHSIDYKVGFINSDCIYAFTSDSWGVIPQDGDWSMGVEGKGYPAGPPYGPSPSFRQGAFSMALNVPLDTAKSYKLSYYIKGFPTYPPYPSQAIEDLITGLGTHPAIEICGVKVGTCPLRDSFGSSSQEYHTSIIPPSDEEWTYQSFTFKPVRAHGYIYCQINVPVCEEYRCFGCFVDNFVLSELSSVENFEASAIEVYPNPFTDRVQIESSGVSVAVYGILGKLHFEQAVQSNQKTVLRLSALPAGVYVLKVFDAFGEELGSEKLIKTR